VLVVYREDVAIKIPTRVTSLYAAPPARPVSKLSIDGIRDVIRIAKRTRLLDPESGGHHSCHEGQSGLATSRSPLGDEP
jgi:hypothetical protein